ncbi:hypothetical protein [Bacteroides finegoldii]|uniref:hypothetical protein n=1 Tax=Bacteroides finegoldii TaxID=338188 RepID=UPI00189DC2D3|nr:hypothetical protein [Bacteroides finegoldii]
MRKNKTGTKVYGSFSDSFYYAIVENTYHINKKNEERVHNYKSKQRKIRKALKNKLNSNK